jgi:hypothetical protein
MDRVPEWSSRLEANLNFRAVGHIWPMKPIITYSPGRVICFPSRVLWDRKGYYWQLWLVKQELSQNVGLFSSVDLTIMWENHKRAVPTQAAEPTCTISDPVCPGIKNLHALTSPLIRDVYSLPSENSALSWTNVISSWYNFWCLLLSFSTRQLSACEEAVEMAGGLVLASPVSLHWCFLGLEVAQGGRLRQLILPYSQENAGTKCCKPDFWFSDRT